MAVSVTGPRAVNELGSPVIPGRLLTVLEQTWIDFMKRARDVWADVYLSEHNIQTFKTITMFVWLLRVLKYKI